MSPLGRLPHALVDDIASPVLSDDDRHHLVKSLRLRDGDELTVTDGAGRWRRCRMGADLDVTSEVHTAERIGPRLTVAFARTKGDRPELAVQKLTELGIDRIVVFVAERSVARWEPGRLDRQIQRLRRVGREATMQSRRVHLPEIRVEADFASVAALEGACMADIDGGAPSLDHPTVLVGPEGGWSDAERGTCHSVRLSVQVLRAETAAITAGALWAALRLGLVESPGQQV